MRAVKELVFESMEPSETPDSDKDKILLFMKHSPVIAASPGVAKDKLTGKSLPVAVCVYEAYGYWWTSVDIWHYSAYNLRLPCEFIAIAKEHYLDHLKRKKEQVETSDCL